MTEAHNKNNKGTAGKPFTPPQRWLAISALCALVIGLGYWWYSSLVWEEKEIDLGYSKEAKQNDFLAAEIFLRKHGVQATSVKNLSLLDKHQWRNIKLGRDDTIVLINGYKTLTQERYDSLYEWVENGGTLIASTQNPFVGAHTKAEDLLLEDFNIERAPDENTIDSRDALEKIADELDEEFEKKPSSEREKDGEQPDSKDQSADITEVESADLAPASKTDKQDTAKNTKANKKTKKKSAKKQKTKNNRICRKNKDAIEIDFQGEDKPLSFDFSRSKPFIYYKYVAHTPPEIDTDTTPENDESDDIEDDEEEEDYHYDEQREHLLYFDIGDGGITITSDNYIWANNRIDCQDHAYGLWRLINTEGRVWFLINQDAPSLAAILWSNASYGVLAALIALLLWLWAQSSRFGPILVVEQTGRRSLAEHIYASAMLLWRNQQHPQLLNLLRTEILERLDQQHPHLDQASGVQRIDFLHQLTGLTPAAIQQALFADGLQHPQEFATAIAHLQTIRKQL
jgi:hypothetical protein